MMLLPMNRKIKRLEGTKEFFKESYAELGPMKWEEKFCLGAFVLALLLAFTRPGTQRSCPAWRPLIPC